MTIEPVPYLRQGLLSNAVTNVGLSAFLLIASGVLPERLGLPAGLLAAAGVAEGVFAGLLGWLSLRGDLPRASVLAIVALNAAWAIDTVIALELGWLSPTRAGFVLLLAQAVVAAMYAVLQLAGLRRSSPALVAADRLS